MYYSNQQGATWCATKLHACINGLSVLSHANLPHVSMYTHILQSYQITKPQRHVLNTSHQQEYNIMFYVCLHSQF